MSVICYQRPDPRIQYRDPTKEPPMQYRRFVVKEETQTLPAYGNWVSVEELDLIMRQFGWTPMMLYKI